MEKVLMTVQEAAEFAGGGMKPWKIWQLAQKKNFYPAIRMDGKRVYIHREKFKQWLDEQTQSRAS